MAEEIEWDYALKHFLGSKKAEELKDKIKIIILTQNTSGIMTFQTGI